MVPTTRSADASVISMPIRSGSVPAPIPEIADRSMVSGSASLRESIIETLAALQEGRHPGLLLLVLEEDRLGGEVQPRVRRRVRVDHQLRQPYGKGRALGDVVEHCV